eukprot:scaffold65829_cov49-Attheya_sp.AAC.3
MSYHEVLDRVFVGDQTVAQNVALLHELNVTHIVACGFSEGFFRLQFRYLCIPVPDLPTANLVRYIPRAISFLDQALQEEEQNSKSTSRVLIHCVHGQSRSCSIAVAYWMHDFLKRSVSGESSCSSSSSSSSSSSLLHEAYEAVQRARPSMAINPGFVQQLELWRRMLLCGNNDNDNNNDNNTYDNDNDDSEQNHKRWTQPYATFRSMRAHSEFHESRTLTRYVALQAVVPSFVNNHKTSTSTSTTHTAATYKCHTCRTPLFHAFNILDEFTAAQIKRLPASTYWKDSAGGRDYQTRKQGKQTYHHPGNKSQRKNTSCCETNGMLKVEPMEWMKPLLQGDTEIMSPMGKLVCPNCRAKILCRQLFSFLGKDTALRMKSDDIRVYELVLSIV